KASARPVEPLLAAEALGGETAFESCARPGPYLRRRVRNDEEGGHRQAAPWSVPASRISLKSAARRPARLRREYCWTIFTAGRKAVPSRSDTRNGGIASRMSFSDSSGTTSG